jgi:hypothetical protein
MKREVRGFLAISLSYLTKEPFSPAGILFSNLMRALSVLKIRSICSSASGEIKAAKSDLVGFPQPNQRGPDQIGPILERT